MIIKTKDSLINFNNVLYTYQHFDPSCELYSIMFLFNFGNKKVHFKDTTSYQFVLSALESAIASNQNLIDISSYQME